MISVQVDFAKHSLCVPRKDFEQVRDMVKEYPDYLTRTTTAASKPTYESNHVLGHMYRHVNISKYYEDCTRTEYRQSIKYEYLVTPLLISYFKNPTQFGDPDGRGLGLEQHLSELKEVYVQIVRPMVKEIKDMMRNNNLINEAELFCTDLEFRSDDSGRISEYIGDVAKK